MNEATKYEPRMSADDAAGNTRLAKSREEMLMRLDRLFRNAGGDPLMERLKTALIEYRLGKPQ